MNLNWINHAQKRIRAEIIKEHLAAMGTNKCVVFTCGNAANYLRKEGLEVVAVGEGMELSPGLWFTHTRIMSTFNGLFDATSGHLPMPLLKAVADRLRNSYTLEEIVERNGYAVPTGSGETFVCLRLAYPDYPFVPIRNMDKGTVYNMSAPLNGLVELLARGTV